jgi:hypothetical protein
MDFFGKKRKLMSWIASFIVELNLLLSYKYTRRAGQYTICINVQFLTLSLSVLLKKVVLSNIVLRG